MPDPSSLTFITRTNTVCIDVRDVYPGPKVPTKDWCSFLKEDLKLKAEDLIEAGMNTLTNYLMVKLSTEPIYLTVLEKLQAGVNWSRFNLLVYGWSTAEILSTVKVTNITCHIDLPKVLKKMGDYGQVINHRVGYLKELPGVRDTTLLLRMKIKPGVKIPSFLDIGPMGESLQVFSDHADKVCFKCCKKGHIAPFCRNPTRAPDLKSSTSSWASVAGGHSPGPAPQTAPAPQTTPVQQTCPTVQQISPTVRHVLVTDQSSASAVEVEVASQVPKRFRVDPTPNLTTRRVHKNTLSPRLNLAKEQVFVTPASPSRVSHLEISIPQVDGLASPGDLSPSLEKVSLVESLSNQLMQSPGEEEVEGVTSLSKRKTPPTL